MYSVKNYGATGDGLHKDTVAIQMAIDECAKQGGGEVLLPAGRYLSGMIELRSNVTLHLEKDAVLLGSTDIEDYPDNAASFVDAVGGVRGKCLLLVYRAENASVVGEGEICGQGGAESFHSGNAAKVRPFLVRVVESKNIIFRKVHLTEAAAWCLHLTRSDDILVEDVKIISRVNSNNDGIDIDASRNVVVRGCMIDSGDDGLCMKTTSDRSCENIEMEGCVVSSDWAGFKIGTESVGDFKNITVKNCIFRNVMGCAIKLVPVDGGCIDNVLVDGITLENCTGPLFIASGERLRSYYGVGRKSYSKLKNITIRNIHGTVLDATRVMTYQGKPWGNAKAELVVSGTPYEKIENVTLSDFDLQMPGGLTSTDAVPAEQVEEMGTQYPEYHVFGVLPAKGIFARHVKNLKTENICLHFEKEDTRPESCYIDAE